MKHDACRDIWHALHIAQVRPEDTVSLQDILQRLIELVAKPEDFKVCVSTMQILIYHFCVLFKGYILLHVVLAKPHSFQQHLVKLRSYFESIRYDQRPNSLAQFCRYSFMEGLIQLFPLRWAQLLVSVCLNHAQSWLLCLYKQLVDHWNVSVKPLLRDGKVYLHHWEILAYQIFDKQFISLLLLFKLILLVHWTFFLFITWPLLVHH